MIEEVDNRLREWGASVLEAVAPTTEIRLGPPGDAGAGPAVSLFLIDLLPAPPATAGRRPSLQLTLRYLVSVSAGDVEVAHRALGALVFAAMEHPEFEVELGAPAAELWTAFGSTPRPCFMLRVPVRLERPAPRVGRVTRPVEIRHTRTAAFSGRLLGPGDLPLAAAEVEIPALRLVTHTDLRGYFRFPAVPAEPARRQVTIRAKGVEKAVTVEREPADGEPVVIHFEVT